MVDSRELRTQWDKGESGRVGLLGLRQCMQRGPSEVQGIGTSFLQP